MKKFNFTVFILIGLLSNLVLSGCQKNNDGTPKSNFDLIQGRWKLVTGTFFELSENNDTIWGRDGNPLDIDTFSSDSYVQFNSDHSFQSHEHELIQYYDNQYYTGSYTLVEGDSLIRGYSSLDDPGNARVDRFKLLKLNGKKLIYFFRLQGATNYFAYFLERE